MAPTEEPMNDIQEKTLILFDASKNELFKLNDGYKVWLRKLKGNWKVLSNREEITLDALSQARVFVLPGPQLKFTETEFNCIKKYLEGGGSLLVLLGEGGEKRFDTNINFLLEEYGIMINNDAVVRTHYYKYFHPKECLISNGVLNRAVAKAAGKIIPELTLDEGNNSQALTFVYPYGATLNVAKPAVAILSTGSVSCPLNRPICAFYQHPTTDSKIVVLGSIHMFSDQFIEKEENNKVKDVLFQFLTTNDIVLNHIDAEDPEISDYHMVPDISQLAERLRTCLQESEEVPIDYTKLFDMTLYSINTNLVPEAIAAYEELGVPHEPLKLITPQFETPFPALEVAVFPPSFRELPNPSLELYDLDEAFSSEKAHLAQLTNKCTDEDLEYYIRECGDILGVTGKLPASARDAKHILEFIYMHLAEFKKVNQEQDMDLELSESGSLSTSVHHNDM